MQKIISFQRKNVLYKSFQSFTRSLVFSIKSINSYHRILLFTIFIFGISKYANSLETELSSSNEKKLNSIDLSSVMISEHGDPGIILQKKQQLSPVTVLLSPGDKELLRQDKLPVFKWSTTNPGQSGITYTLKIALLKEKQSAVVAMRQNNVFFIIKNLRKTIYEYSSKDPKLASGQSYAWQVVVSVAGKVVSESEVRTFTFPVCTHLEVLSQTIDCVPVQNLLYTFKINLQNTCTSNPVYLYIYNPGIGSSVLIPFDNTINLPPSPPSGLVVNYSSSFPLTLPSGGTISITGTINTNGYSNNSMMFYLYSFAGSFSSPTGYSGIPLKIDLPNCNCCENFIKKVENSTFSPTTGIFSSTLTGGPNPITKVDAELVYFSVSSGNPDCISCTNESKNWGNIWSASPITGFNAPVLTFPLNPNCNLCSREVIWSSTQPGGFNMNSGTNINLHLGIPPESGIQQCCPDTIRFCIRFSFTDSLCITCDTLICISFIRSGADRFSPKIKPIPGSKSKLQGWIENDSGQSSSMLADQLPDSLPGSDPITVKTELPVSKDQTVASQFDSEISDHQSTQKSSGPNTDPVETSSSIMSLNNMVSFPQLTNTCFDIQESVTQSTVPSGVTFSFIITFSVTCDANNVVNNVVITDFIPDPLIFDGISTSTICGVTPTVSIISVLGGHTLTYSLGNVVQSCGGSFTINVHFPPGTTCNGNTVANFATIKGERCPDLQSNQVSITPTAVSPWEIYKIPLTGKDLNNNYIGAIGGTVTYRICCHKQNLYYSSNTGQMNLDNVFITDQIDNNGVVTSVTCNGVPTVFNFTYPNVTWNIGNLDAAITNYVVEICCEITVQYPGGLPDPTLAHNTATLCGTLPCGNQSCTTGNTTDVKLMANVVTQGYLQKMLMLNNPVLGCKGYYQIQFENTGTSVLNGWTVTDILPPQLTIDKIDVNLPAGVSPVNCTYVASAGVATTISIISTGSYLNNINQSLSTMSFDGNNLLPGRQFWFNIYFTISSGSVNDVVHNCANVTCPAIPPLLPACADFQILAKTQQLCLKKEVCGDPYASYQPGDIVRLRFRIQNTGSETLTGLQIKDQLDPNLTYLGSEAYYQSTDINTVLNCNPATPTPWTGVVTSNSFGSNPLIWSLPDIPGACDAFYYWDCSYNYNYPTMPYYFIEFNVRINQACPVLTIPNNFTIQDGNLTSLFTSNDAYINITPCPSYEIRKLVSDGGNYVSSLNTSAGSVVKYRMQIINTGNVPLTNIQFTDLLPYPGDHFILSGASRGSQFNMTYNGSATYTINNGSPNSIIPVVSSGIYYFQLPSTVVLQPGETLNCDFETMVSANALVTQSACNSFAITLQRSDNNTSISPAESSPCCITISKDCCQNFTRMVTTTFLNTNSTDGIYELQVGLSAGPNKIKKISATLEYASVTYNTDECEVCTSDSRQFGNIILADIIGPFSPALSYPLNLPGSLQYSREVVWGDINGTISFDMNTVANTYIFLAFPKPPPLSLEPCCTQTIQFCIRYEFSDINCVTCDTLICYTFSPEYGEWNNLIQKGFLKSVNDPVNVELNKDRAVLSKSKLGTMIENWYKVLIEKKGVSYMLVKYPNEVKALTSIARKLIQENGRLEKTDIEMIGKTMKILDKEVAPAPAGLIYELLKRLNSSAGQQFKNVLENLKS